MSERSITPQPALPLAALSWAAFFAAVSLSWAALFLMAAGGEAGVLSSLTPEALLSLCRTGADPLQAGFATVYAMWALMTLAMMAPTAVPFLLTWREIASARPDHVTESAFALVIAGYLAVWLGFAALAALAQVALANAALMTIDGRLADGWLAAGVFALAGGYQFSRLKDACLSKCRSPMAFLMAHWRPGDGAALAIGLRHGMLCLGCCWALMLLGFAAGTMNLVWMGFATLMMIVEKLPVSGRYVTRPLGAGLLAAAAAVALNTI